MVKLLRRFAIHYLQHISVLTFRISQQHLQESAAASTWYRYGIQMPWRFHQGSKQLPQHGYISLSLSASKRYCIHFVLSILSHNERRLIHRSLMPPSQQIPITLMTAIILMALVTITTTPGAAQILAIDTALLQVYFFSFVSILSL